jgi:hypothetical protein
MKRILIHTILLVSVIQIGTCQAGALAMGDSGIFESSLYREKLQLFTDRNLYASGEKVCFSLYNLSHPLLKESMWSRVFYLELINSRNVAVARGKYRVFSWGGDGQITIPDSASTGQYYLRAYTSWMRNYPPSEYFHLPLAIVNPRKIRSADLSAGGKKSGSGGETPVHMAGIACSLDLTSYGKRKKVSARIIPDYGGPLPDTYCISVIKKGYLDEAFYYTAAPAGEETLQLKDPVYYPETRGATVSGTVLLGEEQEPADHALLGMTILGSDPDYFEFMTDEKGRFRIPVQQLRGNYDALLTITSNRDEPAKILKDEAYSSDFSTVPVPGVDFFGERKALVEDVLVNWQLRTAFELPDKDSVDTGEPESEYLFYGSPEFRYRTDDYVALPDLEEFLFEIVPQVRVEKNKDNEHLLVLNDRGEIIDPPPLILLDYVPVRNIGNLLSVSPQRIDYIDIVNRRYFRGGNTYGGIVSVITGRGDRAGVTLPEGSTFIRFAGLSDKQEMISPDYEGVVRDERMPDLRNTLYWAAHYEITPENGGSFTFYTSDVTGEFMVIVRGMTSDGNVLSGTCEFIVK